MKSYLVDLLLRLGHAKPDKPQLSPQLSPHKNKDTKHGYSIQPTLEQDTYSQPDTDRIIKVQTAVRVLLWIEWTVNSE